MELSRCAILCGFLLCCLAVTGAFAADLPANVKLELPREMLPVTEMPSDGWPSLVLLNGYGLNEEEIEQITSLCLERGVAAVVVDLPHWLGGDQRSSPRTEDGYEAVTAALEVIADDARLNPERVVVGGFSQGAFQSLVMGNRYPEKIMGILAISPAGPEALPTMWGGERDPSSQSLYLMAGSLEAASTLDLVHRAAGEWGGEGLRVNVYKHLGGHELPEDFTTELNKALDWLLMAGGC